MNTGDKVCFRSAVVARSGHDKRTADMRGVIVEFTSGGKVARVDCGNTYTAEDGRTVRGIPVANLQRIKPDGVIGC